jgi:hypothetical protein
MSVRIASSFRAVLAVASILKYRHVMVAWTCLMLRPFYPAKERSKITQNKFPFTNSKNIQSV